MNIKTKFILIGSLVIIGIYLFFEHRVHILDNAQYLLFALFIAMHFFMHAGHGGHTHEKKGGHHGKLLASIWNVAVSYY